MIGTSDSQRSLSSNINVGSLCPPHPKLVPIAIGANNPIKVQKTLVVSLRPFCSGWSLSVENIGKHLILVH